MKDYEVLYTEFDYRTNDTDEVRWLAVGVDGELVCEGCHDAGTLSCTVTTDPDGHVVQSFTDGLGRTLLSRTFDDDEPIDTYSVYDDYGRLRWVVTPEGSYLLSDSQTFPVDDDFAEKYCYVYTYNDRGLMVEKRMPGREAEYMRYDEGDRLRVSQDGNLRAKKQWISYSYDALGRVQEQSLAVEAELIPIRSQAGVSIGEPIKSVEPPYLSSSVPLRKYVYDTYPSEVQAAGLDFQPIEGLTATDGESLRYDNATGSLTYEKLAVLANDTITGYHQRAYYYDYKGRLIQTVERDTEDGILCTSQRYDFVGNLIVQRESYTRAGKTDDIDRTFTHDDLSRLTNTDQYVNGELNKQYVERFLTYDRNGNLLTLIRYADGVQSSNRQYTYIGNRLDRMEKDKVIAWDEIDSQPGGPAIVVPGAAMADNGASALAAGVIIDTSVVVHPVDPGIILHSRYAHDRNGNLTYDMELETNFAYNNLNLLEKAMRNDTIVAKYSYLADGTKLSAVNADDCGFAYRGSFTYRADAGGDRVFESTPFGGGRIVGTVDAETEVRYFLTDHLGSVRVVATDQNNVLERNDYYPFGKRWDSASLPISDNRDRFNGKEDQVFIGDCLADYGARMYDRERGRWLTQDPLQQYHSPYVFCGNNPINNIDVDGNWSVTNHYLMTRKALAQYGITGQQAELLSYYASMYADNPSRGVRFLNNVFHYREKILLKISSIDHSGTAISQETDWDPSSPHENANIRHSMRSNWEAQAYSEGREGGISKRDAQLRGMRFGWKNILSSANKGSLATFVKNNVGIQMFGVGLHALQDGYGHAGVSMKEHDEIADVWGDTRASERITQSAIYVHQIVSGDWSNLGGRIDLDLTGMSNAQFQVFLSRVIDYINSKN